MPYTISPGAVLQFTIRGELQNQEMLTVLTYLFNTGSTIPDGRFALGAFNTAALATGGLYDKWADCICNKLTKITVRSQWITPTRYGYLQATPAVANGKVADDVMPTNTAVAVTRRTGLSGRKQQSDLHMPGVPVTFITDGDVSATGLTAYGLFAVKATTAITLASPAVTLVPVPFHKADPSNVSEYIDWSIQPHARTMHRRTVGLGS